MVADVSQTYFHFGVNHEEIKRFRIQPIQRTAWDFWKLNLGYMGTESPLPFIKYVFCHGLGFYEVRVRGNTYRVFSFFRL